MLHSSNNYHKYIAIYLLASLTKVDEDNKFESIFEDYYGILAGDKVMNASHVAGNSPKIAINKPELQPQIIDKLLNIDTIHQGKQKELVKAYAIEPCRKSIPMLKIREDSRFCKGPTGKFQPQNQGSGSVFFGAV